MPDTPEITSLRGQRVLLRRWRTSDRPAFAAMNADPRVMEFMMKRLTREESDAFADRIDACFAERGYGLWAVEIPDVSPFAGFAGLSPVPADVPFAPAIEIGWRLAVEAWGHGYATEAARLALEHAFTRLGLTEIVSFTAVQNTRSQAVMQRIGLGFSGTFPHPRLPEGHPLRPHLLYRITAEEWRRNQKV
ncbi:MAG TPA: GNAT family N-acetyltransferase [Opitutaceae bacterium]|nr:GNAT family N-acetyltransferase [Opitutaceae bacterium]